VSSQGIAKTVRPNLNQEILETLLRNNDLQQLLKDDEKHFQNLICTVFYMNKTERTYFQDNPTDKLKGMHVLNFSLDTVDGLFVHLRENPALCDRSSRERQRSTRSAYNESDYA
jgi:hypothetical protein